LLGDNSTDELEVIDTCHYMNRTSNQTFSCSMWSFDRSQMKSTIIMEYSFVCDKNYFFEVAYSIEQSGHIFGVLIYSHFCDKLGRKPILVFVSLLTGFIGVIQYFMIDFYKYMIFGLLINIASSGFDVSIMPLVMEMFRTTKRTTYGMAIEYVWFAVIIILAGIAYALKTWRELRLTIFMVIIILGILNIWLVEESLTWLIGTCKLKKAKKVIERIIRYNKLAYSMGHEEKKG
jgi:OCT family organic cation transporter-like MFS transporter 4/5